MAGPAWLADSFAALMLLTALYCAGRLVVTRTWRRPTGQDVDLVHVLMGVAMAGMLAPAGLLLPGPVQPGGTIWAGTWAWSSAWPLCGSPGGSRCPTGPPAGYGRWAATTCRT